MKCVSYTRTMPWKNHTGELTIADQNQRIAEYLAEHKEFDLQKKYSDRKSVENASAAFDKMIDDGVGRKFDCIIVASMYYCGPGFPAARHAIKETLYETGVDLIVLEEGLDTRTASRKEVEDYFEEKRCEMHAEIMFAWRKKQGAGFRLTNSVPYGYIRRNGESNMVKDEEVAPYLSEAFSRYASGQKMGDGAEESKKVCYYICRARQADDKCIGHQITEKLLKALVMDQLHLFIVRLSDKRKVLEELRKIEDMQNPVYRAKSEIMSLTDKVSQMAKKREQLYADYVAGVVDSEDYQLIREDYSKQYDGLRAALQRAEAKKVEVEQQIREYLNMTSNLEEHLDDFGFDAQLVKSLVQRIEVSADKRIRIVFGFQDVFADLGKESAGK